ncbi:hypothetical protein [Lacinutrix undariae]
MKKIITFCFFAFALCFGATNMNAQTKIEINKVANEKANELKKVIKFNDNTLEDVYQAYKAYGNAKKALKFNVNVTEEDKTKAETTLQENMKKALTEEEYNRYQSTL